MTVPQFEGIARALKTGRQRAGLSQRELAELVGIGQSHISRIERGLVAPQLSTLLEISRALELEVVMVPVSRLRAVEAVLGGGAGGLSQEVSEWEETMARRIRRTLADLPELVEDAAEGKRLRRTLQDLQAILPAVPSEERRWVRNWIQALGRPKTTAGQRTLLERELRSFRNQLVHQGSAGARAVYQLGDEEREEP